MMMWGTLALYGKYLFAFTGREMGYVSAFAAASGILSQTGLLRVATAIVKEKTIVIVGLLTMGAGLLLLALSDTAALLLVGWAAPQSHAPGAGRPAGRPAHPRV
jgi:hypothetical protein